MRSSPYPAAMLKLHHPDPENLERRLAEHAEDERRQRGIYRRSLLLFVLWPAIAVGVMAWGFQMSDETWGQTIFYAGALIGNLGVAGTLVWAYRNWGGR